MTLEERVSALEQIVGRALAALMIPRAEDVIDVVPTTSQARGSLKPAVQALEAQLIREALSMASGKKARAARLLGISRSALNEKIKRAAES